MAAVLVAMAVVGAACGSDSDEASDTTENAADSSSGSSTALVDEAKQIVEAGSAPLTFEAPGLAIEVGTELEGKSIVFISAALEYDFTQNILGGMEEAAAEAGVEIQAFDAKGDTTTATRQIEQAISQKASLIVIMSFSTKLLEAPIKEAKAAGIPVIMALDGDPAAPTADEVETGVAGKVSFCYSCAGELMAAVAVAQTEGDVNAVVVGVPDSDAAVLEGDGFTSELERLCPDCKAEMTGAPTAQWATQLPTIATSAVQDPEVNMIVPLWAALMDVMKPSLLAAGAEDRISAVTYNAVETSMTDLQNGEFITGIVASPEDWLGWAVMDQSFRVLTGADAVADENIGSRIFTEANKEDAEPATGPIFGDVDFRAEYLALWGLDS